MAAASSTSTDASGVALAVTVSAVTGTTLALAFARDHIDFSAARLFAPPLAALALGVSLSFVVAVVPGGPSLALVALEGRALREDAEFLRRSYFGRDDGGRQSFPL
jgi:hypothetical protein